MGLKYDYNASNVLFGTFHYKHKGHLAETHQLSYMKQAEFMTSFLFGSNNKEHTANNNEAKNFDPARQEPM